MRRFVWLFVLCAVFQMLAGCQSSGREHELADSLNAASYRWRYVSLDSARRCAAQASELSGRIGYADGESEAEAHLAFVDLMRMEYAKAEGRLDGVRRRSRNELLKLMADVEMMRVCQRRGLNYDFYRYCESASLRIKRLEGQSFSRHQLLLWNFCRTDFSLTLSTYYYYLRQEAAADREFERLSAHAEWFEGDTAQLALYRFLCGNRRRVGEGLLADELDGLMSALTLSLRHDNIYVGGKCMASIAEDLLLKETPRPSQLVFLHELLQVPDSVEGASLSLAMCDTALSALTRYGSLFDVSQTHLAMASCLRRLGQPERALEETLKALDGVNRHHLLATQGRDTTLLRPYGLQPDSVCRELQWMRQPEAQAVPEWMIDVREYLCIAYSDLGMKYKSDFNRNVYLDLLDASRQDRRMELRMDEIRRAESSLNRAVVLSVGVVALLLVLLVFGLRRLRRSYEEKSRLEKLQVEGEMRAWLAESDAAFATLERQRSEAEEQGVAKALQLAEQKRQYIDRATSVAIVRAITPFLDRALNVSRKLLHSANRTSSLQYLAELLERIELLNGVLTRWIKVRRGTVSMHVERFDLQSLLDIVSKSVTLFQQGGVELTVGRSSSVVKADKGLTLFMMNTLLDNARKFTPPGGQVSLSVVSSSDYAEIAVRDSGCGLSERDVAIINGERVYDSSKLDGVRKRQGEASGTGFGLMNCRGIIEKYRKTNPRLFSVCCFGVESEEGRGSRFFFRLPLAVRGLALLVGIAWACVGNQAWSQPLRTITDSVRAEAHVLPSDPRLARAAEYADSVYFCNVGGAHERALEFVDSAFRCLNAYYVGLTGDSLGLMRVCGSDSMPEIGWWNRHVPLDYHLVIDLRNEAAIAALALRDWETYGYNNEIYTRLYKLMAQDASLAAYVEKLRAGAQGRYTAVVFALALLAVGALVFAYYYYRHNVVPTFNLRQTLELGRQIFRLAGIAELPDLLCRGLNDLTPTRGVAILRSDGTWLMSRACPLPQDIRHRMTYLLSSNGNEDGTSVTAGAQAVSLYRLATPSGQRVGALAVLWTRQSPSADEAALVRLTADYAATSLFYGAMRMERLREEIALAADERRRVSAEAMSVHVQNEVLDNALSAVKHETMYYPSRIRQLVGQLLAGGGGEEDLAKLQTLLSYYKELFTLLSGCAAAQLSRSPLRRTSVSTRELADYANRSLERLLRGQGGRGAGGLLIGEVCEATVVGDRTMLCYLIDCLLSALLAETSAPSQLSLDFRLREDIVELELSVRGVTLLSERLHSLFYAESLRYDAASETLVGTPYLLARQIVREHDDHVRRGLRIYAAAAEGGGLRIVCTLPRQHFR